MCKIGSFLNREEIRERTNMHLPGLHVVSPQLRPSEVLAAPRPDQTSLQTSSWRFSPARGLPDGAPEVGASSPFEGTGAPLSPPACSKRRRADGCPRNALTGGRNTRPAQGTAQGSAPPWGARGLGTPLQPPASVRRPSPRRDALLLTWALAPDAWALLFPRKRTCFFCLRQATLTPAALAGIAFSRSRGCKDPLLREKPHHVTAGRRVWGAAGAAATAAHSLSAPG